MYSLEKVRAIRGGRLNLDIEQLTIPRGQITAVVGPNGSGKSTLLRLLAFLDQPSDGMITFAGEHVTGAPEQAHRLRQQATLVAQDPLLFDRSVRANVAYGLRHRGISETAVGLALARVGLPEFAERRARQLSGGERQRVALARAIAFRPDVLLLDEPTSNVDEKTKRPIETLIGELAEEGCCVVVTTHDLRQARAFGNNLVALDCGQIRPFGAEDDASVVLR